MKNILFLIQCLICFIPFLGKAQTGLGVTPPRNYFVAESGDKLTKKVVVTNDSKTTPLILSVSFGDWKYDENGNNITADPNTLENSCASWITVAPQSYFTLPPGESKELEITVSPPYNKKDTLKVHTAMLYITQTNPVDSYNEKGALVKVSLRSGIKIYHRYPETPNPSIDFIDFSWNKKTEKLELEMINNGNMWTDGTLSTELVNQNNGNKVKLQDQVLYTLPGDKRKIKIEIPQNVPKGKYIASSIFSYGNDDTVKMAELNFNIE